MGFKRETIEKWSFLYAITKPMVKFFYKTYFRVSVHNRQNIPEDGIVIFAPNHQNALMDALAVLSIIPGQPVFLGRADIFQNNLQNKILTFLKILPIYRIRDGKSNLAQNDAIFKKTIDVLKQRKKLVILPEGNHAGFRRLRPIKKGISRIAFQAEEIENYELNIKVVPVTLDYKHYYKFHSRLYISFGEPIPVSKYYETYQENPPKGMNMLREDLAERLKSDIVHIESETYYDTIDQLARFYAPERCHKLREKVKQPCLFQQEKRVVQKLTELEQDNPEELNNFSRMNEKYQRLKAELNFRNWQFRKDRFPVLPQLLQSLLLIILFPVAVYGFIHNIVPFLIPVWSTKKVKDPQFISSFRVVIAMITFHLWYLLVLILFAALTSLSTTITIGYLASLPISGFIAYYYYIGAKKNISKWRYIWKKGKKDEKLTQARNLYNELLIKMDSYC
jgi:1-acyl-sn-glycerol-3-phosphate acyltransferase